MQAFQLFSRAHLYFHSYLGYTSQGRWCEAGWSYFGKCSDFTPSFFCSCCSFLCRKQAKNEKKNRKNRRKIEEKSEYLAKYSLPVRHQKPPGVSQVLLSNTTRTYSSHLAPRTSLSQRVGWGPASLPGPPLKPCT